jgi:hypothetical protein
LATSGGSIAVAAFPTPFDRSLEVRTAGGTPGAGCLALETPVELGAFEVDLLLSAPDPGTAAVIFVMPDAVELMRLEVGTGATAISVADGASVGAAGIAPEAWYRLRIIARSTGYEVTLEDLAAGAFRAPLIVETGSLVPVGQICLGVDAPSGAAAHYDNLTLDSQSPLGG